MYRQTQRLFDNQTDAQKNTIVENFYKKDRNKKTY